MYRHRHYSSYRTVRLPDSEIRRCIASTTVHRMLTLFSNTWLYDSEIQFDVGNKFNSYDYMTFKAQGSYKDVMVIVYILPVVIAVIGLAVWLKRRNS